jgi:hypothetical protein
LTHYLHIDIVATSKRTTEQDEMTNQQAQLKSLCEMLEDFNARGKTVMAAKTEQKIRELQEAAESEHEARSGC